LTTSTTTEHDRRTPMTDQTTQPTTWNRSATVPADHASQRAARVAAALAARDQDRRAVADRTDR
jgi:hypothetical protein